MAGWYCSAYLRLSYYILKSKDLDCFLGNWSIQLRAVEKLTGIVNTHPLQPLQLNSSPVAAEDHRNCRVFSVKILRLSRIEQDVAPLRKWLTNYLALNF